VIPIFTQRQRKLLKQGQNFTDFIRINSHRKGTLKRRKDLFCKVTIVLFEIRLFTTLLPESVPVPSEGKGFWNRGRKDLLWV
jgi:hypothetical protein